MKKNSPLNTIYEPKKIEQKLYDNWEQQHYFKPNGDASQESFCIMIPPPNVTGILHIGHAFQQTIMDILIRYQRMQGKNTLWQTGTDHAGIATQIMVERKIAKEEGKTRHDYSRIAFVNKIWQWKTESGGIIAHQMRRLGNSVDWERERFTMDEGLAQAVREAFVRLYQEHLIYRCKRLVNWDPKLRTAISDLEVENRESIGSIWHLRYPLANGDTTAEHKDYLVVATTRPETVLGDTAVAVNPTDQRYNYLIGKEIILPLVNRRIPIIGDEYADIEKGTGCVKITPAHDFNDYEIGKRHNLPMFNILTFDGLIRQKPEAFNTLGEMCINDSNDIPAEFHGMERFEARKAVVAAFNNLGLLDDIKQHDLITSYSDRSGAVIEPMLTDQWYMRTTPLAKVAVEVVKQGKIQFVTKQYENMYFSWMRNIQDWCISRQLWWGHRIPAWYDINGKVYVGRNEEEVRNVHNLAIDVNLIQDEDVLDTWFSSSIWTFSTLGWPEQTDALKIFHPTNVVISGFDIIFFWIARMIMLTTHFIKDDKGQPQVPFKIIYITGLIRDDEGKKMSKSKGNVIDPLDMIDGISLAALLEKRTSNTEESEVAEKIRKHTKKQFPHGIKPYGTDALRFTLAALTSTGRDINWDMKRLEGYRNFCNKLWNASRFVIINTAQQDCGFNNSQNTLSPVDRWILTTFNYTVRNYRQAIDTYRFDLAAKILYEFTWAQFCDWYLELSKPLIIHGSQTEQRGTRHTLLYVLEGLLRLAHPIIPFITETLWQHVKPLTCSNIETSQSNTIMLQPCPEYHTALEDIQALNDIEWIKQVITTVRNIRAEMNITPNKRLLMILRDPDINARRCIQQNRSLIKHIGRIESIMILPLGRKFEPSITKLVAGAEIMIQSSGCIDKKTEITRLAREMSKLDIEIQSIENKLANAQFLELAPEIVVNKAHNRLKLCKDSKLKLQKQQEKLKTM